jgi:hypothetical protein
VANNNFNDNEDFMVAGRVHGIPYKGKWFEQPVQWTLGLNGLTTRDNGTNGPATIARSGFGLDAVPGGSADNAFVGRRASWAADTQLRVGPFELTAEYLNAYFDPSNNIPAASFHGDGWYVMGTYFILPNKLQALVRYDTFVPWTSQGGNSTDTWTFGMNYLIKGDNIKLMANYMIGDRAASGRFPAEDDEGRLLLRLQLMY